jgi:hypothetical protein
VRLHRFLIVVAVLAAGLAVGASPAHAAPSNLKCEADGVEGDLRGTCTSDTGAVYDLHVGGGPDCHYYCPPPGGYPNYCETPVGRELDDWAQQDVWVTLADQATGAEVGFWQRWVATARSVESNITPIDIYSAEMDGHRINQGPKVGTGLWFRRIFFACEGDPHTEVRLEFTH